jgi:hypothetical protein
MCVELVKVHIHGQPFYVLTPWCCKHLVRLLLQTVWYDHDYHMAVARLTWPRMAQSLQGKQRNLIYENCICFDQQQYVQELARTDACC